jgi:hypothetical protein
VSATSANQGFAAALQVVQNPAVTGRTKLFDGTYIKTALARATRDALQAVKDWDPNTLLATHEDDVVDRVVAKHSMTCPVLRRRWIKQMPVVERFEQVQRWHGGTEVVRNTEITIAVPFHGTRTVFELNPSRLVSGEIYGGIHPSMSEIQLTWTSSGDSRRHDQQHIRRYFDTRIDMIEKRLGKCQPLLDRHRRELRALVKDKVSKQRAQLAANRIVQVDLGFPIRQRRDSSKFEKRHTIETVSAAAPARAGDLLSADARARHEPFLADADYEAALRVLVNARNALERNPSMTATLDENKIRDLLLVSLNAARFEGKAAGEVFNGTGRTDILIREDDRNILIAECKIWRGPKTIREALNQLLGYLVWRDTRAAVLLFIRRDNVTEAIGQAIREIKQHPNCKHMHGTPGQHERYDFVFSANDDHNQDIRLAFLPFALRDRASGRPWVEDDERGGAIG